MFGLDNFEVGEVVEVSGFTSPETSDTYKDNWNIHVGDVFTVGVIDGMKVITKAHNHIIAGGASFVKYVPPVYNISEEDV